MECQVVQPCPIAGAANTMAFLFGEKAAGGTFLFGAAPVHEGVEICPGVCNVANVEELFEE